MTGRPTARTGFPGSRFRIGDRTVASAPAEPRRPVSLAFGHAPVARGFTLVEILIAIAVLTILAAIALPQYSAYVRRAQLSTAFESLGTYRMRMEQAYQDGGNYGATNCAVTAPTNSTYFQYTCALTNSGQGFTATATGVNMMAGYTFTTDAAGANSTTAYPGGTGLPAACWWSRVGDC